MNNTPGKSLKRAALIPGDISGALLDLGIAFKASGNEASARCPFHDEKHPSWGVNLDSGVHHCFTCGAKGSFISLVMHLRECDYLEASNWIRERGARRAPDSIPGTQPAADDTTLIMNDAKLALFTSPPIWARIDRKLSAKSCQELGILWDPTREYWIIPIRDPANNLLGWQEKDSRGRYFRNYPKGVSKSGSLFGLPVCKRTGTAVLLESPLDCARLHTVGVPGGRSSFGANVSLAQLDILADSCSRVVLALDNDVAGHRSMERICREFKLIEVYVFNYFRTPDKKDPGEMSGPEIRWGIDNALPAWRAYR